MVSSTVTNHSSSERRDDEAGSLVGMQAAEAEVRGGSLTDAVFERLLNMLVSGDFPNGAVLQERRLAALLNTSRTPVREALARLEIQGLVIRVAGRITTIQERSPREIMEVFAIRRTLEVEASGLAAERGIDAGVLDPLLQLLRRISDAEAPVPTEHWAADDAVHQVIAEAAGNAVLAAMIANLRRRSYILNWQRRAGDLKSGANASLALLAAIQRGDVSEAKALMATHIDLARETVLQQVMPGHLIRAA